MTASTLSPKRWALIEWLAVERGDGGRVSVPWSEIVVDLKLPERTAA